MSTEMTSRDPEYGHNTDKPVALADFLIGTKNQGAHLECFEGLTGPNGEHVTVTRLGSCCSFVDPALPLGGGLLDRYKLTYKGIKKLSLFMSICMGLSSCWHPLVLACFKSLVPTMKYLPQYHSQRRVGLMSY